MAFENARATPVLSRSFGRYVVVRQNEGVQLHHRSAFHFSARGKLTDQLRI